MTFSTSVSSLCFLEDDSGSKLPALGRQLNHGAQRLVTASRFSGVSHDTSAMPAAKEGGLRCSLRPRHFKPNTRSYVMSRKAGKHCVVVVVVVVVMWSWKYFRRIPPRCITREGVKLAVLTTHSPRIHGDSDLATYPCTICLFIHFSLMRAEDTCQSPHWYQHLGKVPFRCSRAQDLARNSVNVTKPTWQILHFSLERSAAHYRIPSLTNKSVLSIFIFNIKRLLCYILGGSNNNDAFLQKW